MTSNEAEAIHRRLDDLLHAINDVKISVAHREGVCKQHADTLADHELILRGKDKQSGLVAAVGSREVLRQWYMWAVGILALASPLIVYILEVAKHK